MKAGDYTNFETIAYLEKGNRRQISAFETLNKHPLLGQLADYNPLLVGTVPIAIDIPGSDLDIICDCSGSTDFEKVLKEKFAHYPSFNSYETHIRGQKVIIAGFMADEWEVEIFGQELQTNLQNGYRHMIVEHQLLQIHGNQLREKVIMLKKQGYKTEPAFAAALNIGGDPYLELLKPEHIKP